MTDTTPALAVAKQHRDSLVAALEAALDGARGMSLDAYDNPAMRHRIDTAGQAAEAARCLLAGVVVSRLDPASSAMVHLTAAAQIHIGQAAAALQLDPEPAAPPPSRRVAVVDHDPQGTRC